jgi:hypothetical protein
MAVFGDIPDPGADPDSDTPAGNGSTVYSHNAVSADLPDDGLAELDVPCALKSGESNRLARPNRERDIPHHGSDVDISGLEDGGTDPALNLLLTEVRQLAGYGLPITTGQDIDDALNGELVDPSFQNITPVAEDGDCITHLEDLVKVMRDVDDRDSTPACPVDLGEKLVASTVVEASCWLVEKQDSRASR